jgi:putative oxidoreductase
MNSVDVSSLLLRIPLGVMIALHGWNKAKSKQSLSGTAGWFQSIGMKSPGMQAKLAAGTEVLSGILLIVGLFTPIAAGALGATMIVAIVVAHRKNGFFIFNEGQGWEYCAIILTTSLAVGSVGGQRASLDNVVNLDFSSFAGLWIALACALVGAGAQLALFYRPVR